MRDLDLLRLERRVGQMLAPLAETPGAAVGVARDGALLLRRSAGLASLELNVPISAATTFRIASVSKQFTCAAILMLAREGKLTLDDPLGRHLPSLPPPVAAVTLDQAMRNSGGLRDVLDLARLGGADLSVPVTDAELDALIHRQDGVNFAPGSRFLYSNTGFRLLGQVIEAVTGEALADYLERRIFDPLGMTRTRHTPDLNLPVPGLATGYLPDGAGGWRRAPHGFPLGGEGGLTSCVEDLALYARALSLGTLKGEMEQALEAQGSFPGGMPNLYARGLEHDRWRGVATVGHGGLWPGYKTAFLRVPDRRLTVIVITNNGGLDAHHMALQVLDAALGSDPALTPPPPALALEGAEGSWLCAEAGLSLDIGPNRTARMHGVPFGLAPTEDRRLAALRGAFPFRLTPPQGPAHDGVLEVELDAGHRHAFRRAAPCPVPALDGAWHCAELGATWTIEGETLVADGPLRRGARWRLSALGPRHLRVHMPSVLFDAWADVVVAEDGRSMVVNSGRARGLIFRRA